MSTFKDDVLEGLSSTPKFLPSRYFYDEKGDKLFQKIMHLEEYYLTGAEYEILEHNRHKIINSYLQRPFQLVELGAGDGLKTKLLIEGLVQKEAKFSYLPVDISQHALDTLWADLSTNFPGLEGHGLRGDYFSALKRINGVEQHKMVLFLGSNIGNFTPDRARVFLKELRNSIAEGDRLLIGVDLKKDPIVIRKAYNDSEGITREFNLNLLTRINRELGGDFQLDQFEHTPEYDSETGAARSYLTSKVNQEVYIEALATGFHFDAQERVATEISQKYSIKEIETLASDTGFKVLNHYTDSRHYFVDSIWEATN